MGNEPSLEKYFEIEELTLCKQPHLRMTEWYVESVALNTHLKFEKVIS